MVEPRGGAVGAEVAESVEYGYPCVARCRRQVVFDDVGQFGRNRRAFAVGVSREEMDVAEVAQTVRERVEPAFVGERIDERALRRRAERIVVHADDNRRRLVGDEREVAAQPCQLVGGYEAVVVALADDFGRVGSLARLVAEHGVVEYDVVDVADVHRVVFRSAGVDVHPLGVVVGRAAARRGAVVVLLAHDGIEHGRVSARDNRMKRVADVELARIPVRRRTQIAEDNRVYGQRVAPRLLDRFANRGNVGVFQLEQVFAAVGEVQVCRNYHPVAAVVAPFQHEVVAFGLGRASCF